MAAQARTRDIESCLIAPDESWTDWRDLGLLDLDAWPCEASIPVLPPYPLVGVGRTTHPLAGRLDALIEQPISMESVRRQVARAPLAAAAAMSLLRGIEGMEAVTALRLESLCYGMMQGSAEHAAWLARRPAGDTTDAPDAVHVTREGATLCVALDRPRAHNRIDRAMRDRLFEAFSLAALDTDIGSVRLRAVGKTFSLGADLAEFGTTRDPAMAHAIRARSLPAFALAVRPGILDVHVQGACVGAALEMAAFAGRLTAEPNAWFQLPELAMGVIPGAGGCVSLPQRIGRQRTALLLLSGRRINAATALRWGLIDAIVNEFSGDEGGAHHLG